MPNRPKNLKLGQKFEFSRWYFALQGAILGLFWAIFEKNTRVPPCVPKKFLKFFFDFFGFLAYLEPTGGGHDKSGHLFLDLKCHGPVRDSSSRAKGLKFSQVLDLSQIRLWLKFQPFSSTPWVLDGPRQFRSKNRCPYLS